MYYLGQIFKLCAVGVGKVCMELELWNHLFKENMTNG